MNKQGIMKPSMQTVTKSFLAKKYNECLTLIEMELKNNENSPQLRILQAGCWIQLNINHVEAEKQLNKVIRAEPDNAFAYYGLGLNFYSRGDFDKCLDPFTRATELNPATQNRAAFFKNSAMKIIKLLNDATSEFDAGRCSKALEILSLAVLVEPDHAAVKRIVKEESDKFLRKIVFELENDVLADDNIETILNHVNFLVKSGRFAAADKMIPVDELMTSARGWFLKGFIKYMLGSVKLSLVYTKKALEMDETMNEAKELAKRAENFVELIDGASEQMKLNENDKAIEMLTTALEVDDDNKRIVQAIYFQRAVAKFNSGKQQEAFDDYLLFEGLQNYTGMIMDGIKF
jgi:tetratricopeptide (TPR) repeat protein